MTQVLSLKGYCLVWED